MHTTHRPPSDSASPARSKKWKFLSASFLTAMILAGCAGERGNGGAETASGTLTETGSTQGAPTGPATTSSLLPFYRTIDEYTWRPLDPHNASGPKIATLWGDPTKGAYGALLRFPAGFASPMHTHSADEHTVTIQGTARHWTETEAESTAKNMTPGSYTMIPANINHVSACAPGGPECIAFLTQDTSFDTSPATAAPSASAQK